VTTALLVVGYLLAVPFTLFVPGFLRLWRRREAWTFAAAQVGALLITAAYVRKGQALGVVINGGWAVGLTVAYVLEGLKRARSSAPAR
jgi:hypothetical protein